MKQLTEVTGIDEAKAAAEEAQKKEWEEGVGYMVSLLKEAMEAGEPVMLVTADGEGSLSFQTNMAIPTAYMMLHKTADIVKSNAFEA